MNTTEYADKIVEMISARPSSIDLDKLIYEIYVRSRIADARRERQQGHWTSNEKVMEEMWSRINSKSAG